VAFGHLARPPAKILFEAAGSPPLDFRRIFCISWAFGTFHYHFLIQLLYHGFPLDFHWLSAAGSPPLDFRRIFLTFPGVWAHFITTFFS
jgi:hypothetical protein